MPALCRTILAQFFKLFCFLISPPRFFTAASCVCVPWFFGLWGPHGSSEAQVTALLERQLQRCGPENQTWLPCVAHSFGSWTTLPATGLVGFIGGLLAAATVGSLYLLFNFRQRTCGLPNRDRPQGSFDLPSSPTNSRDSSKSSISSEQRRRQRPALPLAILSGDQIGGL